MRGTAAARRAARRFGQAGLTELVEPALRRLVEERVGVPSAWLSPDVSFDQDLAVDDGELTEVIIVAERAFDVSIPEAVIDRTRTYGDLVEAVVEARADLRRADVPRVFVRAAIVPAQDRRGTVLRSAWLSPYVIETWSADARRMGTGVRLELIVPASAPLGIAERVERCFAGLADAGVTVVVQHERLARGRAVA